MKSTRNQSRSSKAAQRNKTTRSISFDNDIFALMEERRKELRMDRSNFLVSILEDVLGVLTHPEIRDFKIKADQAKIEKAQKTLNKE